METNYRSSKKLVEAADRFIRCNPDRYEKHMITPNPPGVPAIQEFVKSRKEQYRLILNCVRQEGKELAILYRNNESVIPIVDLFDSEGIPYRLKEHQPVFFSHFVVRDIRNYYTLAADPSNFDLFSTMYYQFHCGISKENIFRLGKGHRENRSVFKELAEMKDLEEWKKDRILDAEEHLKRLNKLPTDKGIALICHHLGYRDYLDYRIDRGYPAEKISQKFGILQTLADRYRNKDDFWQRLAALENILKTKESTGRSHAVTLSTIHSAKGLEWEKVMLIDCIEGEFPSRSALKDTEESKALLAEEVRLFYVGVTRAKRELIFINIRGERKTTMTHPVSRFVKHYLHPKSSEHQRKTGVQNEKSG